MIEFAIFISLAIYIAYLIDESFRGKSDSLIKHEEKLSESMIRSNSYWQLNDLIESIKNNPFPMDSKLDILQKLIKKQFEIRIRMRDIDKYEYERALRTIKSKDRYNALDVYQEQLIVDYWEAKNKVEI